MFHYIPHYIKERELAKRLPSRIVEHEEFVRLSVENGVEKEKAEFQGRISKALGSYTRVGNEMLQVKPDE